MSVPTSPRRLQSLALFLGIVVTRAVTLAQPPPLPPNPLAPVLNVPSPPGMQRGTAQEVTLSGANLADPTGVWTNIPGVKLTIPTDNNNGKDAAKLRVKFEVPADVPLGYYGIRVATSRGMSNFRIFCIDDLPQFMEVDTNRSKSTPQPLIYPSVLIGRMNPETSSWFKITVKANERVSFDLLGHRLGSAFDPQLRLYSAATGKELPGGYSNDSPGCQTDPRLTYTFKTAGDYLIEIRDVKYGGGADFFYRLRIGDFPCATAAVPMAVKRGAKAMIAFAGPVVDGVPPVEVQAPSDPAQDIVWVTPRGANGLAGWPVSVALSNLDETVEQEPNNEAAKANRVPVPGAVSGRLLEKGDVDFFVFTAKKGQRLLIDAHTLELYSPTLLYMVLRDSKGAEIGQTKPEAVPPLDQRIDFNPPADGDYTLEARHLNFLTGPSETYRISITPHQPGFTLSAALDRYDVPQTSTVAVQLMLARRDYAGPVEVTVAGDHPGITGQVTIPAGQPAAPNVYAATLFIHAAQDVPVGPHSVTLVAKATIGQAMVVEYLDLRSVISQSMGNLTYPPRQFFPQLALAVTPKPPFSLAVKLDQPEVLRGVAATVTITATKDPGFDEEIAITAGGLPPTVPAALKNISKGQTEAKIQLTPAPAQPIGNVAFSITGKAKFQNKDFTVSTLPTNLPVVLPFELKVEPVPAKVNLGANVKVKVTATRKGGYQGPIALEVRNLPANVTAAKATIEQGKNEIEIEIAAAANAVPGDKADVNVFGTAPAAANQQNASPNFTVSVVKP
jgi:hypothetical protein